MKLKKGLTKKIFYKVFDYKYGYKFYDKRLKYVSRLKDDRYFINNKKLIKTKKFKLKLASKYVWEDSISFWKKSHKYKDIEDVVAAHRWSWVMPLLDDEKYNLKTKKLIISALINNWLIIYSKSKIKKKEIINEPYTISERLANFAILMNMKILDNKDFSKYSLVNELNYLLLNMEVYSDKISNHVLNNIRAIFLYSILINNQEYKNFSIKAYKFFIKKLINKDGFFIFGSSHYQFIFTKWVLDFYVFSINKKIFEKVLKESLSSCRFLMVKNKNNLNIPLFGDVSPDFEPKYIIELISNFFKKKKIKNKIFLNSYKKILTENQKKKIFSFNSKKSLEWNKIENNQIKLFSRNPNIIGFDFNHAHYDYFHFVMFYKNKQIFVDQGKQNYDKENIKYNFPEFHNSIEISNSNYFNINNEKNFFKKFIQSSPINYVTKSKKNMILNFSSNKKIGSYSRKFNLKKNCLSISDCAKLNIKKNLILNFFLTNNLKLIKGNNQIILKYKNENIIFSINTNNEYKIKLTKKINSKDFEKYGDKVEFQRIQLIFTNMKDLNLNIKVLFG